MDDDEPQKTYPLSPAKLSKTPSWVMLGFLLGAAFVWAFKSEPPKPAAMVAAPATPMEWPKAVKLPPSPLTTVEALFAEWGQHAVWEEERTEIAMWRSETGKFSEFYEVRRMAGEYFFRSIPELSRRIVRSGTPLPNHAPLQFTESERHYQEWLRQGRDQSATEASGRVRPRDIPPPMRPKVDATVPTLDPPRAVLPPTEPRRN